MSATGVAMGKPACMPNGERGRLELDPCFIKQLNLLETLAGKKPTVTEDTLGKTCGRINTWPVATVREAAKKVYGSRAYPGLGHGAQGGGALREIECRDLVALSVMMTALTPYLAHRIDSGIVYRGAA